MGTEGGPPPLKVDPELLERYGNQLLSSAQDIPSAPTPFVVSGSDAISAAIADKLPAIEGPLQDELPRLKADAAQTASRIVSAAGQYQRTDQQVAANYEKHQFDRPGPAGGDASSTAGGANSSLMSMPMQMASQAAQLPMQAMSAVAAVPQSVMQGVQEVGQMVGGLGSSGKPEDGASAGDPDAERAPDEERQNSPRHAAPEPVESSAVD